MNTLAEFITFTSNFFLKNSNFIMTITTMMVGIVAGWFPTLKKSLQRSLTIIVAIVFVIIVALCYQSICISVLAIILSMVWCLLSLCLFKKEEVSRKKIGKLIVDFTEAADMDKPICIFGGDLNFFGDYIPPRIKNEKKYSPNEDIEKNEQFTQILHKGFRTIKILAVKPYSDTQKDRSTRRRIGYIVTKLGEKVKIKFFEDDSCNKCKKHDDCIICDCNNCPQKNVCPKPQKPCEKLNKYCENYCFNPDTTLRGRIVTNKDSQSHCVAIATTKESGKKYILREYSAVAKECQLYQVIWEVWWSKCKYDNDFIKKCKEEYEEYRDQNK